MPNAGSSAVPAVCLVCDSPRSEPRFVQRGYPVLRCAACGFEYVAPTPSARELAEHYDHSYAVSLERYAAATSRNAARIAELERWCPARGRLLEVGAAYGHSLALASERGWEVAGVELSPHAAAHARDTLGLAVFNCDLADAPLPEASFDAVVMWHVLEHVRDPKAQLLRLAALLKPGGILGIRVPNIESFGARFAGQWWPWMCPPAHLWFFSCETLPRLLRACAFEVLEARTLRGDGNNLYQYALMAAGNRLNDLRRISLRKHRAATARAPGPAASVAPARQATAPAPPSGLLQTWLRVLERAQPLTNTLARATRPVVEALERRGWGDELLVYARRLG